MNPRRHGMTLLELMVAIAIGAMVLVGLRALLVGVSDASRRTHRAVADWQKHVLGEMVLRRIVLNATRSQADAFLGEPEAARFASVCPDDLALPRDCPVALRLGYAGSEYGVILEDGGESRLIQTLSGPSRIRYLRSAAGGGVWERSWSRNELPQAITIAGEGEMMVLPIGISR